MNDQRKYFYDNVYATSRWKRLRLEYINSNPLNALCLCCYDGHRNCTSGMTTTAKEKIDGYGKRTIRPGYHVDHIIPLAIDYSLAFLIDNLRHLCIECHSRKTNVVDKFLKRKMKIDQMHDELENFD